MFFFSYFNVLIFWDLFDDTCFLVCYLKFPFVGCTLFVSFFVDNVLNYVAKSFPFGGFVLCDRENLDWIVKWVGIYFAFC